MRLLLALLVVFMPIGASAAQFDLGGYGDVRFIVPADEKSWLDGGLGKFRLGSENGASRLAWTELVGDASLRVTPGLSVVAVARIEPEQIKTFDLLEAYVRYRPVSTTPWRWNTKLGAFFPPISLENTDIGWTSPWTLTPSAINSWVGEELRTIGGSAGLEYRQMNRTIALDGAILGWNDPAGILLAFRGWAMDDRPTGLFDKPRLPDALAAEFAIPTPWRTAMFRDIDDRPGWYVDATWEERGIGRLQIMRYDNNAALSGYRGQPAWRTDFWSVGYRGSLGAFTLLMQGMTGTTAVAPTPARFSEADYNAAYVLIGWQHETWRLAARLDGFNVQDSRAEPYYKENGHAYTFAANWEPKRWVRVSAEVLRIVAARDFREDAGLAPHTDEVQFQLGVRLYY